MDFWKFTLLATLLSLHGCCSTSSTGSTTTCSVTFTNPSPGPSCSPLQTVVTGYAIFSNGSTIAPNNDIIIQWSTDSFATVTNLGGIVNNSQNLVAVPFSFTLSYCSTAPSVQLRAFQTTHGSESWTLGNVTGRYDGTDSGNATYTSILATVATNVLIFLDGTGPQ